MANALSGNRFIDYARGQISDADAELDRHTPQGQSCGCGQQLPCGIADELRHRRAHYQAKIAEVRAAISPDAAPAAPPSATLLHEHRTGWLLARLSGLPGVGVLIRRRTSSPEGSAPPCPPL